MNLSSERGDIVLGWLTKLVVALSLVGVVAFDGASLLQTRFGVEDRASSAARVASEALETTPTAQAAFDAASAELDGKVEVVEAVTLGADGSVTVRVSRDATTLVLHRIGPLRHLIHAEAEVTVEARR